MQRIEFRNGKRLANIDRSWRVAAEESIIRKFDIERTHDWTARFSTRSRRFSAYAEVMGQSLCLGVESPGRLAADSGLSETYRNENADLFGILRVCFGDEIIFYHDDYRHRHTSLSFNNMLHLQDCGLINPASFLTTTINWANITNYVYTHQTDALMITRDENAKEELRIPAVLLTTAGKELLHVAQSTEKMEYLQDFSTFLQSERCHLSYLKRVNTLPDGTGAYGNPKIIEPRVEQVNGNAL